MTRDLDWGKHSLSYLSQSSPSRWRCAAQLLKTVGVALRPSIVNIGILSSLYSSVYFKAKLEELLLRLE